MQPHQTDILQQDPVHSHLLNVTGREPNDQDAPIPRRTLQTRIHHAHRIVHNIHPPAPGRQPSDLILPPHRVIIDRKIRPEALRDRPLPRRPGRRNDRRPKRLGHLHGRQPHPARRRVHEHVVAPPDARPRHQRPITRRRRHHQPRRLDEIPPLRHGPQRRLRGADPRRVPALARPEDAIPRFERRVRRGRGRGRGREDDAGELAAGDPGEGRLGLVPAPDLEEVEEVGGGGADGDEVFVRGRGRVREGGDDEVAGALGGLVWLG